MVLSYPLGGAYLLQTSPGIRTPVNLLNLCLQCTSERAESARMGAWPCGQDSGFILALVEYVGELEQSPFTFLCSVFSSVKWGLAASTL